MDVRLLLAIRTEPESERTIIALTNSCHGTLRMVIRKMSNDDLTYETVWTAGSTCYM